MKRILFVDHVNRILGGAEINLIELLSGLPDRGPLSVACACHRGSPLHQALAGGNMALADYRMPEALNTARFALRTPSVASLLKSRAALGKARQQLREIIGDIHPQVVISCTNKDHFAAGAAARHHRIPSVWWVNDIVSPAFFSLPVRTAFLWQARRYAARVVAVSEFARQALLKAGLPEKLVTVIRNGIPVARYQGGKRGSLRRLLGIEAGEPLVGIVGRFTPWKGQDFFLKLAQAWAEKHRPGHFVLIGAAFNEDRPFEETLHQFVHSHALEHRVHFVPFQTDMAAALADLDVLIHASVRPEPFGRVIIEAMAAEVPVLAARAGGVPEIITHEVDGLLAESGRLDDYLMHLNALLSFEQLREKLAARALDTVKSRFSLDRVRRQFEEVIEEVR